MPSAVDRRERVLAWIPPGLMLAIACLQIILVYTIGLSPWRGGGFGMFSVVDHSANRVLSAECIDAEGRPCLIDVRFLDPDVRNAPAAQYARRLRARPYSRFGDQLADALIAARFVPAAAEPDLKEPVTKRTQKGGQSGATAEKPPFLRMLQAGEPGQPGSIGLKAVRVRVWRLDFDAATMRATSEPIGEAVERGDWR